MDTTDRPASPAADAGSASAEDKERISRAEERLRRAEQKERDAEAVWAQVAAEARRADENTARLRALRLDKERSDALAKAAAEKAASAASRKKPAGKTAGRAGKTK